MHGGTEEDYSSEPHHGNPDLHSNQYTDLHNNQYSDDLVTSQTGLFDVPPLYRARVQGTPVTGGQRSEITPWHESGIINSGINGLRYVIQPAYQQTTQLSNSLDSYHDNQDSYHSDSDSFHDNQYGLPTDLDYVTSDNLGGLPGLHSTELLDTSLTGFNGLNGLHNNISSNQVPYNVHPSEITSDDISLHESWDTGSSLAIWINSTDYGNLSHINGTSGDREALDILGDVTLGNN